MGTRAKWDVLMQTEGLEFDAYCERRRLRASTVQRLRAMDAASRAAVLSWAIPFGMNDNQLCDVLDTLDDIAARRGVGVDAVCADPMLDRIRVRRLGRSDTIREFRSALRQLRYPQLSAALARIEDLCAAMKLPRGTSLEVPPDLEGDEVGLTIRARSAKELRARVAATANALEGSSIESIFAILLEGGE